MACKRCSTCGINYPPMKQSVCGVCGSVCQHQNDPPDPDWEKMMKDKRRQIADNEPVKRFELPKLQRSAITEAKGQAWIADSMLEMAMYDDNAVGDIIRVAGLTGDIYFELDSVVWSTEPSGKAVRGWWINRVDVPTEAEMDAGINAILAEA